MLSPALLSFPLNFPSFGTIVSGFVGDDGACVVFTARFHFNLLFTPHIQKVSLWFSEVGGGAQRPNSLWAEGSFVFFKKGLFLNVYKVVQTQRPT